MKNKILLFFVLLILPAITFAIPVTYIGNVEFNSTPFNTTSSMDTLWATSALPTTGVVINQTQTQLSVPFTINHLENPSVLVEFFFQGLIVRRYTQPLPGTIVDLHDVLVGIPDIDQDGVPDYSDDCAYVYDPSQADIAPANGIGDACDGDQDGDGVPDPIDTLFGNGNLIVTNIQHFTFMVDNDTNISKAFTGLGR